MNSNKIIALYQDQRKHDKQLADLKAMREASKVEFYRTTVNKHIARFKKG